MSYDSIIEVLALALLEQANEVGCLEVLDGFSQRPDTEIEVSAPISEEMLILPLDKQEWPEECAPILKESGVSEPLCCQREEAECFRGRGGSHVPGTYCVLL